MLKKTRKVAAHPCTVHEREQLPTNFTANSTTITEERQETEQLC